MNKMLLVSVAFTLVSGAFAACTVADATKTAEQACEMMKANIKGGKGTYDGLAPLRFCGDQNNYVWAQKYDKTAASAIVTYHPVSAGLIGKDMTQKEDKIKNLFTNLSKALAKSYETGKPQSLEYQWAKQGETTPSDKVSVLVKCTDTEGIGAGFWK